MSDPRITDVDREHWPLVDDDLRTFEALDPEARRIVLALLGSSGPPTEADHEALQRHPNSQALATWLLSLPAYRNARRDHEDDFGD